MCDRRASKLFTSSVLASLRLAVKSGKRLLTTQVSSDVSGCRQPGPGVISSSRCLMKLQISPPFRHHLFSERRTHSLPQQRACMWHAAYEPRGLYLGPVSPVHAATPSETAFFPRPIPRSRPPLWTRAGEISSNEKLREVRECTRCGREYTSRRTRSRFEFAFARWERIVLYQNSRKNGIFRPRC